MDHSSIERVIVSGGQRQSHGQVIGPGLSLTMYSFLDALIKGLLKVLHSGPEAEGC